MSRCEYCNGFCSDGTECGMNQIADPEISTRYYDNKEKTGEGENK